MVIPAPERYGKSEPNGYEAHRGLPQEQLAKRMRNMTGGALVLLCFVAALRMLGCSGTLDRLRKAKLARYQHHQTM